MPFFEEKKGITIPQILDELKENSFNNAWVVEKRIKKNTVLVNNTNSQNVVFVNNGILITLLGDKYNKKHIFEFHRRDSVIGFDYIMSDNFSNMQYDIKALEDSHITFVNGEFLLNYLSNRPTFMEKLTNSLAERIFYISNRQMMTIYSRERKVINGLVELCRQVGEPIDTRNYLIPACINKTNIAEYCGVDRSYFSKVYRLLEGNGAIELTPSNSLLIDIVKLEEIMNE